MAVFNDLESVKNLLRQEVKLALDEVAIEIQEFLRNKILVEIYNSYSPKVYQRTSLLLNSVKIKSSIKSSNEYSIEIYIPEDVMHSNPRIFPNPDIGVAVGEHPSLAKVAEIFADGIAYGRGGANIDVVKDTQEEYIETGRALQFVLSELRKKFDVI